MVPVTFNRSYPITPSNSVDVVTQIPGGLSHGGFWIGDAGDVTVVYHDGMTALFTCTAGTYLPIACKRINATGTSAAAILALCQV
jgi:hypothetical protein